jgi:prepilin-type N-terminal cleavage/methylation domain-containing protein
MLSRGFTLIELLVVIAVMGAVMALVGPLGAEQIAKTERNQEIRNLESILYRQSQTAFLRGISYSMSFDGQQLTLTDTSFNNTATIDFKHLFFTPTKTYLNLNGIYAAKEIEYFSAGKKSILRLDFGEHGAK